MFFSVDLSRFEANFERESEKEVKHNMSTLFLQLTQVLMLRIEDNEYPCHFYMGFSPRDNGLPEMPVIFLFPLIRLMPQAKWLSVTVHFISFIFVSPKDKGQNEQSPVFNFFFESLVA